MAQAWNNDLTLVHVEHYGITDGQRPDAQL